MLVEDNPDEVELALRAFEKNHFSHEIVILGDGEEAVDWFASGVRPALMPEVVLLDLNLPKLDGLEVLRRLRAKESTRRVPIVMFTSSGSETDIAACYEAGANGFVRKPLSFSALVAVVHRLGLYWLTVNEPPSAHASSRLSALRISR